MSHVNLLLVLAGGCLGAAGCGASGSTPAPDGGMSSGEAATLDGGPGRDASFVDTGASDAPRLDDAAAPADSGASPVEAAVSEGGVADSGVTALPCQTHFQVLGHDACQSTLEGYEVKFVPLANGRQARAISVYFHSDTAVDWDQDWGYAGMADWSYNNDVVLLAARSEAWASNPGQTPWRVWYNTDEVGSRAVSRVIDDFVAAYHPTSSRTLYAGSSGGSIYLTGNYFAYVANLHPGVMVANCGAGKPLLLPPSSWDTSNATLRAQFFFYFNYGTADFLAPQIQEDIAYLTGLSFHVDQKVVQGADHCAFSIDETGSATAYWGAHL